MDICEFGKSSRKFNIEELVEHAARIIPILVPKQERYKVTDFPDVRTVRFYATRGLIDKPDRYDGQQSIYTFKHLLQLIVIKYLQSQYLTIKKIGQIFEGLSETELLKLINVPTKKNFLLSSSKGEAVSVNSQPSYQLEFQNWHEKNNEKMWKHYNIESGVEISVREDFQPTSPSHIEVLANRVRIILKEMAHRRGG